MYVISFTSKPLLSYDRLLPFIYLAKRRVYWQTPRFASFYIYLQFSISPEATRQRQVETGDRFRKYREWGVPEFPCFAGRIPKLPVGDIRYSREDLFIVSDLEHLISGLAQTGRQIASGDECRDLATKTMKWRHFWRQERG